MKKIFYLVFALLLVNNISAQKKSISLEDIYKNGSFRSSVVFGLSSMNDGLHYSTLAEDGILQYEYAKPSAPVEILSAGVLRYEGNLVKIQSYQFSADESKILIGSESEQIFRHSSREHYYVYDRKAKTLTKVSGDEKQMYASFSPDGTKVGFVRGNNIYVKDIATGKEIQVTDDGKQNSIINGATDWVHEEEFAFSVAYFWSPDSKKIAYYRFDESNVKEFSFTEFNKQLYPSEYKFKYPKAGEANSVVTIHTYDLNTVRRVKVDIGAEKDQYIPRIKWTADANTLSLVRMNRLQNKLELMLADASTGASRVIYTETSKTFIDIHEAEGDYAYFTADNKNFIITNETDGYNHIYLYDMAGKLVNQITKGNWDVVKFKGIDEKSKTLFYIASETTATEKDIYSIKMDGSGKKKISVQKGTHDPSFSKGMKYYIDTYSEYNTPTSYAVCDAGGKQIRIMEENTALKTKMNDYNLSKKEFLSIKTSDGIELNGWIIKPPDFNEKAKHPVFLTFYGGPGRTLANNSFDRDYFWQQMLAQKGYIVVCVDNRGTMYRGRTFKDCTYKQLGKFEVADQIDVAKYLGSLGYVDKTRIGCFGWSYGGYLSSLCITKGADVFKMAIAVAPVTNWRYYDNIYTERFMALPQDNASGYDDNSPINHVSKMKGKYLLIHGSGDDNVHVQNTMEMISAMVAANKQFELFIYPDKNHNIRGGNTSLHLYTKMTEFILANL